MLSRGVCVGGTSWDDAAGAMYCVWGGRAWDADQDDGYVGFVGHGDARVDVATAAAGVFPAVLVCVASRAVDAGAADGRGWGLREFGSDAGGNVHGGVVRERGRAAVDAD